MEFVNSLKTTHPAMLCTAPLSGKADKGHADCSVGVSYVLVNKVLWHIAFAHAIIYLVRYKVLDGTKELSIDQTGWTYFTHEYAVISGKLFIGACILFIFLCHLPGIKKLF